MHRATTTLGRIQTGAEPFKIGAFTAVHLDAQKASGRKLKRVFRAALDGFGQLFGRDLAKREVNFGEVLAVEGIKFGVVCGAVFGTEPPAPVAAFRRQERFVRLFERSFGRRARSPRFVRFDSTGVNLARSEERRVGKECRCRWAPYAYK